jgi:predicted short-subunit dehydrogenase-like oxidoreductase (DUF2520 family)
MEIVIIGTGNTASVLGKMLKAAGHRIAQVYGRDAAAASALAYELDSESTNYWAVVTRTADIYILAVSDIAIPEVLKELHLTDKTIVHTAASVSKDIFRNRARHYGVMYPLQSLKKGSDRLPEIPVIIDASDENTLQQIAALANTISDTVVEGDDEARLKMHMAAVFCNNFVNHIYALMQDYCEKEKLDFSLFIPLIEETARRLKQLPAADAQTGPALRRDEVTLEKHREILKSHPSLLKIYDVLTESIRHSH